MTNLLTLRYWFNSSPEALSSLGQAIFLIFLAVLFVLSLFFIFSKKKSGSYKIFYIKFYNFCFVNFILGVLFWFFNYQRIHFFSARFWLLFWLIFMIFWLINIFKYFKKVIANREDRKKKQEFNKYLP